MTLELVTECGGNSFSSEEGNAVLITPVTDDEYIVAEHIFNNYPAWGVYSIKMGEDNVINHIQEYYDGWTSTKCNVNVNLNSDNTVIGIDSLIEMISDVMYDHAEDNDYTLDENTIPTAIDEAAKKCKLYLTRQTFETIKNHLVEVETNS